MTHDLNIGGVIDPIGVKQKRYDIVVGFADAVGGGDLLALEVGGGVVAAVREDIQGLAADVGAAYEGDVHAVGYGDKQLCHHAGGNVYLTGAERFYIAAALNALGSQAGFLVIAEMIRHGGAGGAAVRHEVMDSAAVSGLLLHGLKLFCGGGQVKIGHIDSAAFDIDGNEQRLPLAGGGGLGSVEMLACFVYFDVLNGADLDLAVVVGIGYNGRGGSVALGVAAGFHACAGAHGQRQDQCQSQGYKFLCVHFFLLLFIVYLQGGSAAR